MKRRKLFKALILLLSIPEWLLILFKKKEKKIIYGDWNDIVIAQWGGCDNQINKKGDFPEILLTKCTHTLRTKPNI